MKQICIALILILSIGSCNNWLSIDPENERLSEEYWEKEEDVHNTMMSAYVRLRGCLEKMVQWGEIRADIFEIRQNGDGTLDMENMKNQNITTENKVIQWDPFYKVINSANAVIKYAPIVMGKDPLFTETDMNQYIAEAKVVRSLVYFYLLRTFKEVPLILEPYTTDVQEIFQSKSSERAILDQIFLDLKWAMKRVKTTYYGDKSAEKWQNKARATRWSAQTLLADVYLWDERYSDCISACDVIIDGDKYRLLAETIENSEETEVQEGWLSLFYPGLSDESIWELYYDHANNQKNDLFPWFNKDGRYYMNQKLVNEDFTTDDLRGKNITYYTENTWLGLWKYVGTQPNGTTKRPNTERSANWIFYRYADVLLMQSEAYCMLNQKSKSIELLNRIKKRAGIQELDPEDAGLSQKSLLTAIMQERKLEFVGEGKRWFDLVRYAKKNDFMTYKSDVIEILLNNIPMAERAIYKAKLSNSWSFYLPIHKDEIDMGNGILVQNPAY